MFVLFNLETGYVGEDATEVYEFDDDTSEDTLDEYGQQLADDHAEMYGHTAGEDNNGVEYEGGTYTYEILEDMTKEEIEEEYGEISRA